MKYTPSLGLWGNLDAALRKVTETNTKLVNESDQYAVDHVRIEQTLTDADLAHIAVEQTLTDMDLRLIALEG